jgi:hypothetical protein
MTMRRLLLVVLFLLAGMASAAPPEKADPAPAKGKRHELRLIRVGNTFQSIRFNVSTGEAWTIAGDKFEKVPETTPVPAGDYDVTLVTDDTNWMAFRIERVSGSTWQMRGNKWLKIKEPEQKE